MTRLVYVLGASHSGSTLLTMLLNAHPGVATIGALAPAGLGDLGRYLCSCGRAIRRCGFWRWLAERASADHVPFTLDDFGTAFRMPGSRLDRRLLGSLHRGPWAELLRDACLSVLTRWPRRFAEIARANEVLVRAILDYYCADVFADKGNLALRLKHLLRTGAFDIKVIRLVRDGRAVALTYTDAAAYADAALPSRRGGGMGAGRPQRWSMAEAAYDVRRCHEEADHVLARLHRSQWVQLRYEQLCKDTDRTMERLFSFIGVDPSARVCDFRSVEHHILGNGMRLDCGSEVRLDERWREVLTPEQLRTFDSVAGRVNRRHGYV